MGSMAQGALLATFMGLGTGELVVILIIILVLFGGASLPKLSRSLGSSIKEFKSAVKENAEEEENAEAKKEKKQDNPSE